MSEKREYKIPALGSLGLLALGDIGLKKWREVRGEIKVKTKEKQDIKEGDGEKDN